MKFCKDCYYFKERHYSDPRPPSCKHEAAYISTDPVYGNPQYRSCEQMRNTICGPEAKLWKQK
jgi:hypothetical protein